MSDHIPSHCRRTFLAQISAPVAAMLSVSCRPPRPRLTPILRSVQSATLLRRTDVIDVNGTLWAGNAAYQTNRSGRYGDVILGEYIARAFQNNPNLTRTEAQATVNSIRQFYDQLSRNPPDYVVSRAPFDVGSTMLTAIGVMTGGTGAGVTTLGREALSWGQRGLQSYLGSPSSLVAEESIAKRIYAEEYQGEVWQRVFRVAQSHPEMEAVIDDTFGDQFNGVRIGDSAFTMLEKSPDFADHETIRTIAEGISEQGHLYAQVDSIKALSSTQHEAVMGLLRENTASIASLNVAQQDMIAYLRQRDADEAARAAQQA